MILQIASISPKKGPATHDTSTVEGRTIFQIRIYTLDINRSCLAATCNHRQGAVDRERDRDTVGNVGGGNAWCQIKVPSAVQHRQHHLELEDRHPLAKAQARA